MSNAIRLVASNALPPNSGTAKSGNKKRRRRKLRPPYEVDECLSLLTEMCGPIALGTLTPAQANAIRNNLVAIMQMHTRSESPQRGPTLSDATVMEIYNSAPEVLNSLVSLLTPEQRELIRKAATKTDGQA